MSDLEATSLLPDLFATTLATRVGEVSRSAAWWQEYFADVSGAATPTEFAVSVDDGEIDGYVVATRPMSSTFEAAVHVVEMCAANNAVRAALIAHVVDGAGGLPVRFRAWPSDPDISSLVDDAEVVLREALTPQLWIRLVDVADALVHRRYGGPDRLVIEVSDDVCGWNNGCYLLDVDDLGAPSVERTSEPAMLMLDVRALASGFVGASSFRELVTTGGVKESLNGSIAVADAMFSIESAPFCTTLL